MTPRNNQDPSESHESTDDAVWRDLVARLEETPDGADDGDTNERMEPERSAGAQEKLSDQDRVQAIFTNQPFRPAAGPRDYTPAEEDGPEGYEPPEPPRLGVGEPLMVLAWLGTVGGPLTLLLIALFWRSVPTTVMLGVIALFVTSVVFLILRLPKHRDANDDGAAV